MVVYHFIYAILIGIQTHTEKIQGGSIIDDSAVRLSVYEITPSSYRLSHSNAGTYRVKQTEGVYFLYF